MNLDCHSERSEESPSILGALALRAAIVLTVTGWLSVTVAAENKVDFTRDVRPILSGSCFKCHGPDDGARKSKLRLDLRDAATLPAKTGAIAIVPGKPDKSELVKRIYQKDEDEVMPPPAMKHPLTDAQKQILKRWIAEGAEYKPHWAFVAPKQSPPPKIKNTAWPRVPFDAFVLARLEREGLKPSPEADKFTLCRRVYLDLIGLPPTSEEADAFVNDKSPQAYEKLVDTLLASPRYGERWARRWLDLARYADTNGYEKDRDRSIWPYRDWVIRALNADMPFDEFTIEQLAGDMLDKPTQDQLIATGFHRNTMLNEEGGIDPLEFRFHAMTDRVATTATTWLGLTMGCAQCHTHKYDPITQREYYGTMAFLNNADEPDLDLITDDLEQQRERNRHEAAKLLKELPDKWPVDDARWRTPKTSSITTESGETPKLLDDGSALFATPGPDATAYTIVLDTGDTSADRLRIEALTDPSLPKNGPGRAENGNFVLSEIVITSGDAATPVKIVSATADAEQDKYPVAAAFDGDPKTGWAVDDAKKKNLNAPHTATFTFDKPVSGRLVVKLEQRFGGRHTLGRLRLSLGAPAPARPPREVFEEAFTAWLKRERERVVAWTTLRPTATASSQPVLTTQPDGSVLASGDIAKSVTYDLTFRGAPTGVTAVRLEAMADDRLPGHGPGMAFYEGPKGDFFLAEFQLFTDGKPVKFARASEDYANNTFAGSPVSAALAIDGDPQTGWACSGRLGESHYAVFVLSEPLAAASDLTIKLLFARYFACPLGKFRIAVTTDKRGATAGRLPVETDAMLLNPDAHSAELHEAFLLATPEVADAAKKIRELSKPATAQTTLVMRERPPEHPRPTHLHHRGDFLQPKDEVQPVALHVLHPLPKGAPPNRLTFARWLVSPDNPLTARVTVNRQWHAMFGRGLVRTTEDFGFQGEVPTHPEVLDWLAVEFMKQGWSLKKLHKLIVTSATYRQSSWVTPVLLERDPQNKLLARGPRVRLEAEQVRDAALLASGLLSEKMFGAPVRPPQPAGVTEVAYGNPKWDASQGPDRFRRSIYTFQKRSAPFAMLVGFDAPSGEACVARRDVSNSPLQSLTLLNDVAFVEIAQALGNRIAGEPGTDEEKLARMFRRCATRPPIAEESQRLLEFLRQQRDRIAKGELNAEKIAGVGKSDAAWTTVARALLNLDETITKN